MAPIPTSTRIVSDDGLLRVEEITNTATGQIVGRNIIDLSPEAANRATIADRLGQAITTLDTVWANRPDPTKGAAGQPTGPSPAAEWAMFRVVQALARLQAQRFEDAT